MKTEGRRSSEQQDATETVLVALDRPRKGDPREAPSERLVVQQKSFEGHPFFDVRLAFRNQEGGYTFTKKGVSVRRREAPAIIAALWASLDDDGKARVRELLTKPANNAGAGQRRAG